MQPPIALSALTHSKGLKRKRRSAATSQTKLPPDLVILLEPLSSASLTSLEPGDAIIKGKAWLTAMLEAGRISMTATPEDAELKRRSDSRLEASSRMMHAARMSIDPSNAGADVLQPSAAAALKLPACFGSLIVDSQEAFPESQDLAGPYVVDDAVPLHKPASGRTDAGMHMQGQGAPGAGAQPATANAPGARHGCPAIPSADDHIEWIGCPQEPPAESGLKATETRRFFGACRKVSFIFQLSLANWPALIAISTISRTASEFGHPCQTL